MAGDSFVAQEPAGIRWLHVHPDYVVTSESWEVVRLAQRWREGQLPGPGAVQDQPAWTVAAIEVVTGVWNKMEAAVVAKAKKG